MFALCPDFNPKRRVGDDAIEIALSENGRVLLKIFREDGITAITPEYYWPMIGTGEPIKEKVTIETLGDYDGNLGDVGFFGFVTKRLPE